MVAAAVVTTVFLVVAAITWLSSRADASQSRCEDLAQHIRGQLEMPPPGRRSVRRTQTRVRP